MSKQEPSSSDDQSQPRRSRDWVSHLVIPILAAVIGAVLVTALTPLGTTLRELIFPTKAVVTGTVTLNGQGAANAALVLDETPVPASETGSFVIPDVRAGTHVLHVEAVGAEPLDKTFSVAPEAITADLGGIELAPVAHLGYYVSLSPRTGSPKIDYEIALWIDADEQTLADIKRVRYTLPDPLPAKPVKGKRASIAFCYTRAGTLKISDFFGPAGSFGAARTKITLVGGVLELSSLPGDIRPPEGCPTADGGGGGGGSGGSGAGGSSGSGGAGSGNPGPGGGSGGSKPGGDPSDPEPGGGESEPGSTGQDPSDTEPVVISCSIAADGGTYQAGPNESATVGQEVRWVNNAQEVMSLLDITDDPSGWGSGEVGQLGPGEGYSFTFSEAGSHSYTCVYASHKISGDLVVGAK